jgi:DNA-3-methyladenine glycosylase I
MTVVAGPDGKPRCEWAYHAPAFPAYHDLEWGFPEHDNRRLFEKLCLEAFQSGLSWRTILDKRENFRAAFADFDFYKVAKFDETDVERLLADAGIVRNRSKIEATIHNARQAVALAPNQSLSEFVWSFEPPRRIPDGQIATSLESIALAKELKKMGWKFVGPTTAYAFMQAMGLVNDHAEGCFVRDAVEHARTP